MINKHLSILLVVLFLTLSLMIIFNVTYETGTESISEIDNDVTTEDVIDEIEMTLLEEDNEIEIGDMI